LEWFITPRYFLLLFRKEGILSLLTYLQAYNTLETQLGWTSTNYTNIISMTLEAYGVDTEDEATDLLKLHKIGIWQLWEGIKKFVAFDVDLNSDGANIKRSQMYDVATKQAEIAKGECNQYLADYKITVTKSHNHSHDEFGRCRHYEIYH
jgi:hypothetical protein